MSIVSAEKFLALLDAVYKKASLTSILDTPTQPDFSGVNTVKVMKVTTTGLGDYSKQNGYAKGNATLTWEALSLQEDRSAEFDVDRMDNEEALGQAFGAVVGEFTRLNVAPEVDAYRFAKYAKAENVRKVAANLADAEAVVKAVRVATAQMDEDEVTPESRYLFITPTLFGAVQDMDTTKSREVFKRFAGVIEVPQTRFYDNITMNSGADAWGYTKAADAKDINFMVVEKSAIVQAKKLAMPKIFDPDTNQDKDAWKLQYRLYHDAFVYENKTKGIYVHTGV